MPNTFSLNITPKLTNHKQTITHLQCEKIIQREKEKERKNNSERDGKRKYLHTISGSAANKSE
jgi:hypothetical protein